MPKGTFKGNITQKWLDIYAFRERIPTTLHVFLLEILSRILRSLQKHVEGRVAQSV
jgi:hypothetical protein